MELLRILAIRLRAKFGFQQSDPFVTMRSGTMHQVSVSKLLDEPFIHRRTSNSLNLPAPPYYPLSCAVIYYNGMLCTEGKDYLVSKEGNLCFLGDGPDARHDRVQIFVFIRGTLVGIVDVDLSLIEGLQRLGETDLHGYQLPIVRKA